MKRSRLPLIILCTLAVLYVTLKYAVSYVVLTSVRNTVDDAVKHQVKLANISFEPLSLTLKIQNLHLDDIISLDSLVVDVSWSNLFQKKLHIAHIQLDGFKGNITQKGEQFLLDGLISPNPKAKTKKQPHDWRILVDKAEIVKSLITINHAHSIEIQKAGIYQLDFTRDSIVTDLKASVLINKTAFVFDGSIKNNTKIINFAFQDFDLKMLNSVIDSKKVNFGDIQGTLSSQGVVKIENDKATLTLDLELKNAFLYSKDRQFIHYFIEELKAKNVTLENDVDRLKMTSSALNISHVLLSLPEKAFEKDRLSTFSKIEIDSIDFSQNKKTSAMKGIVHFRYGGFFALNHYQAKRQTMIDIQAKAVDLTQFSSAFEPLLNYQIESGKLSIDAKAALKNEKIRGKVKVNLSQMRLDNKNEFGKRLETQSSIPLKTAISMIQDDNGNIDLDFKLYGNQNDPNFDILAMMGKGIGSVVISKISSLIATKAALKFAPVLMSSIPLSPSNVFMFTNGAYKIITKPRFKDINFITMTSDIQPDSQADLMELTAFLNDNKKVKFHICPVASTLEFQEENTTNEQVLSLANKRVESLKQYFKNHQKPSLNQIIFCRPKISTNKNIAQALISL